MVVFPKYGVSAGLTITHGMISGAFVLMRVHIYGHDA